MCRTNSQNNQSIGYPDDRNLPFFAYGFFKKGELAYNLIKDCVSSEPEADSIKGNLYNKDGIPIFVKNDRYSISIVGNVIKFKTSLGYCEICSIEPKKLYRWDTIITENGVKANILVARNDIVKGAIRYVEGNRFNWKSKDDALFDYGMKYLDKEYFELIVTGTRKNKENDFYDYFDLQMAYVFLWTIVDRYCTLKYKLSSSKLNKKYEKFSGDCLYSECYEELLMREIRLPRAINSSSYYSPENRDLTEAQNFLNNLYTIRNNAVHRGKTLFKDVDLLKKAFLILYGIMHSIFAKEFTGEYDHKKIKALEKFR